MNIGRGTPRQQVGPAPLPVTSALVVLNGNASSRDRQRTLVQALEASARAADVAVETVTTDGIPALRRALRSAGERRVVLAGGDGSLHAVLNAGVPPPGGVALLPAGRANNVARALGIPADPAAAARVALAASCRPLDVLAVDAPGQRLRCVEGVSAGFHADARSGYHGTNSADLGAGLRALAAALRRYRPWPVEIEVDGREVFAGDAGQVFVSNLPLFGFGFRVDPLADPRDGVFEVIVAEAASRREIARLLAAARSGRHIGRPGVAVHRGRRAAIRGGLPLAGDATPLGAGDVTVTIERGHVKVAAP